MDTLVRPAARSMASNPNRKTRLPQTREGLHGGSLGVRSTPEPGIMEEEPGQTSHNERPGDCLSPQSPSSTTPNTLRKAFATGSENRSKRTRFPVKVSNKKGLDDESIWQKYQRFWESDQAGLAIIAHDNSLAHNIVVVKKMNQKADDRQIDLLRKVTHDNMVKILDMCTCASLTYIVYESLETSLDKVQATCRGELTEIDMAIISKEVRLCTSINGYMTDEIDILGSERP